MKNENMRLLHCKRKNEHLLYLRHWWTIVSSKFHFNE